MAGILFNGHLFVSLFEHNQSPMADIDISVVIPVYNSGTILPELSSRLMEVMEGTGKKYELIFCDDCSRDNSWDVLRQIKEGNPGIITAIQLSKNYGQHNATLCGMSFARGKLVVTMDDDLQHPPDELPALLEAIDDPGIDVVYGTFRKKSHSMVRNAGSYSVRKASKHFLKGKGKGSSFRVIDRTIVDKILEHRQYFIFIDELILWYTDNISFVNVRHDKRKYSKSNYTGGRIWKLFSNLVFFYTSFPLKMMVYGGFVISVLTFLLGLQFILRKIFLDLPLGYASVIVAILFSTSIIILSLGIIGEYLRRMHQIQNNRPPFNIHKVL
jgi:undecaprenyl-phosphate 4-deoxy-4-formamido-L-arabinose transferase